MRRSNHTPLKRTVAFKDNDISENLILIHLNPDGNPDISIPVLLREISRLTVHRVAVTDTPAASMRKVIDGFIQSGIPVELLRNTLMPTISDSL